MRDLDPFVALGPALNAEILALYREGRSGSEADFKDWAMARAKALVPFHSSSWINGVMTGQGPVFHDVRTTGLGPGYWDHFLTLMDIDPLGPRMFAEPGRSFITGYADMPPRIVDEIMLAFDVRSGISGMAADPSTGIFSVVCWHRDPSMPDFTEVDRAVHELLLQHWVECLSMHRVGSVLREFDAAAIPGFRAALVDSTGLIHHAQAGFGELLSDEFAGWLGTALPADMIRGMNQSPNGLDGHRIVASWRRASNDLWMVHARRRFGTPVEAAREVEAQLLAASLEAREHELEQASAALHEQQKQHAITQERQRIMRELHDGVGAHLVGLLNLVNKGVIDPSVLESEVTQALDEMRMAVDSLQPVHGDLATVLGMLRYRLQPRLDAAGIGMTWDVPDLPSVDRLSPSDILQIHRILLEAFTNVLKHAKATAVTATVRLVGSDPCIIELVLCDNGIGLPADASIRPGHGLKNMRLRAQSLGAALSVGMLASPALSAARHHGTEVRLSLPLQ